MAKEPERTGFPVINLQIPKEGIGQSQIAGDEDALAGKAPIPYLSGGQAGADEDAPRGEMVAPLPAARIEPPSPDEADDDARVIAPLIPDLRAMAQEENERQTDGKAQFPTIPDLRAMAQDEPARPFLWPLTGKVRNDVDPIAIGQSNFRQLTNLRYTDASPRGVLGMTKIITAKLTA